MPQAVPCRKSFVLLISDGEYTDGTDEPTGPALKMHSTDIRNTSSDFPPHAKRDGVSIFAFSSSTSGANSMKAISMFGAFTDISTCSGTNLPYNASGVPSDSKNYVWPRPDCNPERHVQHYLLQRMGCNLDARRRSDRLPKGYPGHVPSRPATASSCRTPSQRCFSRSFPQTRPRVRLPRSPSSFLRGIPSYEGCFRPATPRCCRNSCGMATWKRPGPSRTPTTPARRPMNSIRQTPGMRAKGARKCRVSVPRTSERHCWDAGEILQNRILTANPPRNVFTAISVYNGAHSRDEWQNVAFSVANLVSTPTTGKIDPSMLGLSGSTAFADATDLIKWTLGYYVANLRLRADKSTDPQHKLGDIVYSTPVIGGPPSPGAVSPNDPNISDFYKYRNQTFVPSGCKDNSGQTCTDLSQPDPHKHEVLYRDKVVYVGANDGMVHAFLMARWDAAQNIWVDRPLGSPVDPGDTKDRRSALIGTELWAYIPSNLLKKLQLLAAETYGTSSAGGCAHRAMVDLADQVFEVFIPPPGSAPGTAREWRSVLIGGERGGGDTYFAIDVTDPWDPKVMWDTRSSKTGW